MGKDVQVRWRQPAARCKHPFQSPCAPHAVRLVPIFISFTCERQRTRCGGESRRRVAVKEKGPGAVAGGAHLPLQSQALHRREHGPPHAQPGQAGSNQSQHITQPRSRLPPACIPATDWLSRRGAQAGPSSAWPRKPPQAVSQNEPTAGLTGPNPASETPHGLRMVLVSVLSRRSPPPLTGCCARR
eukprot:scaffold23429_cov118-Isochrysis_galbana.AAC.1